MKNEHKSNRAILEKLNISELNPMQKKAQEVISSGGDVILLSPTGTGKTLAFILPLLPTLDAGCNEVQILILVPSRELAIQIEQVIREMGTGFKTNAVYGGRAGSQDKIDLKQAPAILIGTPGRVADHIRKNTFSTNYIHTLVLDEFDKSLEVGFESDIIQIIENLNCIQRRILTSATQKLKIPDYVGMQNPKHINHTKEEIKELSIKTINSLDENKLETLINTLQYIGNQPGIIFCNFKDTIQEVSDYLSVNNINHGCFHGDMEQTDRERVLIKFRNGTYQLIVATDLAARGLDIPELKFIIHYQLPPRPDEFIHRNGRTARMKNEGTAFVLKAKNEDLPVFIKNSEPFEITEKSELTPSKWITLYVSGGRRDKISKGDIAGLFLKQGELTTDELGMIEIKQDCSYVAVLLSKHNEVIQKVNNSKLKKKKVRISVL